MNPDSYQLRMSDLPGYTHMLNEWVGGYENPIILDKVEKKFFRELIQVCNDTHEKLHGKASRAAKEILEPPGYEAIFGLKKGQVL